MTSCVNLDQETPATSAGAAFLNGGNSGSIPAAGDWWKDFDDTALNQLMCSFEESSPSLDAALARREQVLAELGVTESALYPTVSGDAFTTRSRDSSSGIFVPPSPIYSQFEAALNLQYEIDLWGRVRKSVLAAEADYLASEGDAAAAILSLKASLARNWYQLRFVEEEVKVVRNTVDLRKENRDLIRVRVEAGDTTDLDLARAESEMESARAQLLELERTREEFIHAVAALVGTTPSEFKLPAKDRSIAAPEFPPGGVPSELLDRRPDVFAARVRVEAAAARIGVTQANFLPRFTLAGRGGVSSLQLSTLLDPESLFGDIGPEINIPIFQAGRAKNEVARAEAQLREAFALYREAVLNAVRDTETSVTDAKWLDRQIDALSRSASAATRASKLSRTRFEDGFVSYIEVIDADRAALTAMRELIQARAARQFASIRAVQALGGGWAAQAQCEDDDPE